MKTLTRRCGRFGEPFKPQRRVHKIAQNKTCRHRFSTQKQRCRLVKQRFRERRITLDSSNNGLLEITRERHGHFLFRFLALPTTREAIFRSLYSACKAFARSISGCCRRLVPPPNNTISDSPSFAR